MKPFTAGQIAQCLMRRRWRTHFCLPNYKPRDWWECDVFEITAAGTFREYEIKRSHEDFVNDTLKKDRHGTKHDRMGQPEGPQRFWFVTPAGIITPEELPAWAGLIEVRQARNGWLVEHEIVTAPRLHKAKIPTGVQCHAESVCYYRMHNLFRKVHQ